MIECDGASIESPIVAQSIDGTSNPYVLVYGNVNALPNP